MNEKILVFFSFCFRMISIWRIQTDHIQKWIRNISPCRGSVSFYSVLWNWNMFDCSRKSISWIQQRSPNRRQQQNDPNDLNGLKNWESHHQTKRKTHSLPPPPPPLLLPLHLSGVSFHFRYVLIFHTKATKLNKMWTK